MGFYGPKMPIIRICEVIMLKEGEKEQSNYCCGDANLGSKFPDWWNWIPAFAEGRTAKKEKKNSKGRNKKATKKQPKRTEY